MKLDLYSDNFLPAGRFKLLAKKILRRDFGGPKAVQGSLVEGLLEIGADYSLDKAPKENIEIACVLSGYKTLDWAIRQKQAGKINKIIAGPNIVVLPTDRQGILGSREVNMVIVPSQWVMEKYINLARELKDRIRVWAAGVSLPDLAPKLPEYDFLVYNKTGSKSTLLEDIIKHLSGSNFKFKILDYGSFSRENYFHLLEKSKNLIYLSESESQGLAMFEAWARGVPTFVWDRGYFEGRGYKLSGNTSSPYLSAESGERFKDFLEFKGLLPKFLSTSYSPREYIKNNFTNALAAKKYLEIAGSI